MKCMHDFDDKQLRLSVLTIARDYLESQYQREASIVDQEWQYSVDFALREGKPLPKRKAIKVYQLQELLEVAEALNSFVTKNKV